MIKIGSEIIYKDKVGAIKKAVVTSLEIILNPEKAFDTVFTNEIPISVIHTPGVIVSLDIGKWINGSQVISIWATTKISA